MALLSFLLVVLYFATKSEAAFVSVDTSKDDDSMKKMAVVDRIAGELQQINSRLIGLEALQQQTDGKVDSSMGTSEETKEELSTIKSILKELLTHCKTTASQGLTTDEEDEEAKDANATARKKDNITIDDVKNNLVDLSIKLNETMQRVVNSLDSLDDVEKEVDAVKGVLNSTTNGQQKITELDKKLNGIANDVGKEMDEVQRGVTILEKGWNSTEGSLSKLKNIFFNLQLGYCYRAGHKCPLRSFSTIPLPDNVQEVTISSQECQVFCDAEPRCNSYNTRSKKGHRRCQLFEDDCARLIKRSWSGGYFVRASSLPRVVVAAMSSRSDICRVVGEGFRPSPRGRWKGV